MNQASGPFGGSLCVWERYALQSGDQSTTHARSPTISNALPTIALGLVRTRSPRPLALMRFLARTRAPMPLESMNVRPDRSTTTVEPASSTSEFERPSADATSNSPYIVTTWTSGRLRTVMLNWGNTAKTTSAEGCRWQIARRSVSALHDTPISHLDPDVAGASRVYVDLTQLTFLDSSALGFNVAACNGCEQWTRHVVCDMARGCSSKRPHDHRAGRDHHPAQHHPAQFDETHGIPSTRTTHGPRGPHHGRRS